MSESTPMSRATAATSAFHLPQDWWQRADLYQIHMVSRMQSLRKTENRLRAFNIMPQHYCFATCKTLALDRLWTHEFHLVESSKRQVVKTTHGIGTHNLDTNASQTQTKRYFHLVLGIQLESNVTDLQTTPEIRTTPRSSSKLGCESGPSPRGWKMRGRQAVHQKL